MAPAPKTQSWQGNESRGCSQNYSRNYAKKALSIEIGTIGVQMFKLCLLLPTSIKKKKNEAFQSTSLNNATSSAGCRSMES